ncbi:MAG: YIP1 family protein [Eubacteriales bacterium]
MMKILYKTIFAPLGVFNKDDDRKKQSTSIAVVAATIIAGSIIAPILYYYVNKDRYEIELNITNIILMVALSIGTWLAVCALFWMLSKAFKKDIKFSQISSTWGLSYMPNLLCVVLYNTLLIAPGVNNGSGIAAFVICTLFIMLLVWKAILYFMTMRFVIDTSLGEIIVYTAVSAVVFAVLMMVGFRAGIQVPML